MLLENIRLPNMDKDTLSNSQKLQQVLEYMIQLNKKLQFVLQNIDTDNMTTEMAATIDQVKGMGKEIENKVSTEEYTSYVRQTAQALEARVQKDEVIASINMSPEEIKISAPKISLEGFVTVNGFFKIDENGAMEATGGKIAGWTIAPGALYSGENDAEVAPTCYFGTADIVKPTQVCTSDARTDWRLKIGASFGVTSDGTVYAEKGVFRGDVDAKNVKYGDQTINYGDITIKVSHGTYSGNGITDGSISAAKFDTVYATQAAFGSLQATVADIENLVTGKAQIGYLNVYQMSYWNRRVSLEHINNLSYAIGYGF